MRNNLSSIRGSHNIAIGHSAGKNTSRNFNIAFGKEYYSGFDPYNEPVVNKLKELFEKL